MRLAAAVVRTAFWLQGPAQWRPDRERCREQDHGADLGDDGDRDGRAEGRVADAASPYSSYTELSGGRGLCGAALAALAALGLGGSALAGAATQSRTTAAKKASKKSKKATRAQAGQAGAGTPEQALTGDTADKVKAAALVKVDGTVLRVENDRGGTYEAHITKADGTEVEVKVDSSFKVTDVQERPARP